MINSLDLLNFVAKNTKSEMIDELKLLNYIRSVMNQSVGMKMAAKIIVSDMKVSAENRGTCKNGDKNEK